MTDFPESTVSECTLTKEGEALPGPALTKLAAVGSGNKFGEIMRVFYGNIRGLGVLVHFSEIQVN